MDKIRIAAIQKKDELDSNPEMKIYVKADAESNTISIRDTGVGMTKSDMQDKLGTIAKSGTEEFLKAAKSNKIDNNLIGQFGVGFYSAFLVADRVVVVSTNNADEQYIWESTANNSIFYIK